MTKSNRPSWGSFLFFGGAFLLALYFTFAAVQGDFGVFRRAEVEAETRSYQAQLNDLLTEIHRMENLTRRLSDDYLDPDLLDERARDVLGMIRADEIIIR